MKPEEKRAAASAMVLAFTLIASHVVSRAARDALFLSAYEISSLPWMLIGSAFVSAVSVVLTASALRRFGPSKVLGLGCLASAALFVAEAMFIDRLPRVMPVVAFLHITSLGALVISAFWSMVNERFDPRQGRRVVGRAEALAALGGVVGGVTAERLVSHTSPSSLLVLSAGLCGVGFVATLLSPSGSSQVEQGVDDSISAKDAVRSPYVRQLAAIVFLVALSSTLLDYAFKAEATRAVSSATSLARVFAIYYTVVGILTFLLQSFVGPWALRVLGPSGAASSLPTALGGVGACALFFPGFWSMAIVRGLEAVMQNSLYRSGYELLFIPIDPALKRKAKAALDVGVDKFGDSIGAVLTLVLVAIWTKPDQGIFIGLAMASSAGAAWCMFLVRKSYIGALGNRLKATEKEARASWNTHLGLSTRYGALQTPFVALGSAPEDVRPEMLAARVKSMVAQRKKLDVRALEGGTFDLGLAATILALLEDDKSRAAAEHYLLSHVVRCTGLLTDALLDSSQSEKLRRRIPRILRAAENERAAAGLLAALDDRDFEVRFRAGLALSSLIERNHSAKIPANVAFEKAKEALDEHERAWDRVIQMDEDDVKVSVLEASDREHYNKGLQHVFEILGLCLERNGLRRALRALWSGDDEQRGTALEYLGEVLPEALRAPLWPKLKVANQLAPTPGEPPSSSHGESTAEPPSKMRDSSTSNDITSELTGGNLEPRSSSVPGSA